jgi:hypothetical protein
MERDIIKATYVVLMIAFIVGVDFLFLGREFLAG